MDTITVITKLLKDFEERRFYGGLEIKFESGRMVLIRKTETLKPDNFRNNRGSDNERH